MAHHFQTLYADNYHRLAVADAADFQEDELVLDVGTGTSLAAICAINTTHPSTPIRIIGVDLSSKMLEKARKNCHLYRIPNQIFVINCDARVLPLRDSLFDKVISVYGIGGVKTKIKRLFLELLRVGKKEVLFSLGEMTAPPRDKSLLWQKIHELVVEPFINLVWQFKDLNLTNIFRIFNIKTLRKKYFNNYYLGSMTLLVGRLQNHVDQELSPS